MQDNHVSDLGDEINLHLSIESQLTNLRLSPNPVLVASSFANLLFW